MLAWQGRDKPESTQLDPVGHLKAMYRSALERYVVAILVLAVGMKLFEPLYALAGFTAGQVALVAARLLCNAFENRHYG